MSDLLMRRHRRVIEDGAARWRLGPLRTLEDCLSPLAQISQTVASFDFPRRTMPATFHHVGPIRSGPAPARAPDAARGRRAFASLGTLQGGRFGLFRKLALAAERRGLDLCIAHAGGLRPDQEARLAPARAGAFVDQRRVLAESRLAILHGGLNTVMDALAAGVPIVVAPIAFEQQATAARIERCGAGLAVLRRGFGSRRFEAAIERVLVEPSFARAAERIARDIAEAGGTRRAADIVEQAVRTGAPVEARRAGAEPPEPCHAP